MKELLHIHLDAVGGIAGDMFVAALLDAFPDLVERVMADLAAVLPAEAGRPLLSEGHSGGIRALRFRLGEENAPLAGAPPTHDNDDHAHAHFHAQQRHGGSFADMAARIRRASLSEGTADGAVAILALIARAESRIHGVPIEHVHFHEIADWDSLMDVVAAGSIAAALPGAAWTVSELPRGGGVVRTEHGLLPAPAPAAVAILEGFGWRDDGVPGERVTPTGAAILRHLVREPERKAQGRLAACGNGAGTRDLPGIPNILRALVFSEVAAGSSSDRVAVLSFDIDDMTGEEIGVAAEKLRALDGVRDLAIAALLGKKGRPLHAFRLLVAPEALDAVKRRCFAETSTIGLRWHVEERDLLERRSRRAPDHNSGIRVKDAVRPDGSITSKAESDDLQPVGDFAERRATKARSERRGD